MAAERACLMVWDGLRPDMVSPELTPNLWRIASAGVWFERSHAVYPTLTRANSPAIATGCLPGKAGVPGNAFCLPRHGSATTYSSGDVLHLERLAAADEHPVLLADTLADRVHRDGGQTVVVGSGSPGSAWLQHPRALECGDLVLHRGVPGMQDKMQALHARFGPPPKPGLPASDWTRYCTRIIADHVVPELAPTLLVFWHTDPDHTSHARGLLAPETAHAIHAADQNFGTIVDAYERAGLRGTTDFVVASDHGASTITRRVRPAFDLEALGARGAVAENGGSVFVYSAARATIEAVRQLDYAGPVFTRDGRHGTLPLERLGLDGPRAPDLVFSLAWSADEVNGVPGAAVGTFSKMVVDHGTISPFELRNTMVAYGPDFRPGWRDPLPVGNIDICPTLSYALGLEPGTACDGRILLEALRDFSDELPECHAEQAVSAFAARGTDWVQSVDLERVGRTRYVAGGHVSPASA